MEFAAETSPLDLRWPRCFAAVASEIHFGRASRRLYISQSVLSRQIQPLELGLELLVRSSRALTLTRAAEQPLADAASLLALVRETRWRMRHAADCRPRLAVGFFAGEDAAAEPGDLAAVAAEVDLSLRQLGWRDPEGPLGHRLAEHHSFCLTDSSAERRAVFHVGATSVWEEFHRCKTEKALLDGAAGPILFETSTRRSR